MYVHSGTKGVQFPEDGLPLLEAILRSAGRAAGPTPSVTGPRCPTTPGGNRQTDNQPRRSLSNLSTASQVLKRASSRSVPGSHQT